MTKYEIMTITNISLGEDNARSVSNQVKDLLSSMKGRVLDSNFWGRRDFAYEIKGQKEGYYEVINFELDSHNMSKLKSKLNLINGLVRYLIITADKSTQTVSTE